MIFLNTASISNTITGSFANADWGVYNAISNGGDSAGMWRTLTTDEWDYLIKDRSDASAKFGMAMVDGVGGIVLLPDSWTLPNDLTFVADTATSYAKNYYSASQWAKMEEAGAVFLPAAGMRSESTVFGAGQTGLYWSAATANEYEAPRFSFSSTYVKTDLQNPGNGYAVRLVLR